MKCAQKVTVRVLGFAVVMACADERPPDLGPATLDLDVYMRSMLSSGFVPDTASANPDQGVQANNVWSFECGIRVWYTLEYEIVGPPLDQLGVDPDTQSVHLGEQFYGYEPGLGTEYAVLSSNYDSLSQHQLYKRLARDSEKGSDFFYTVDVLVGNDPAAIGITWQPGLQSLRENLSVVEEHWSTIPYVFVLAHELGHQLELDHWSVDPLTCGSYGLMHPNVSCWSADILGGPVDPLQSYADECKTARDMCGIKGYCRRS